MYSQMSKGIFLFFPCTYIHCTRFPTFTCFKCESHFLELEFVLVTSQQKVFNYVQLITLRWDATHTSSTFKLRMPPCLSPSWCSLSVHIQEARDRSPRYEVAVYFSVQKKKKVHSATASPLLGLDGAPASRWLSLGGRSHSERL